MSPQEILSSHLDDIFRKLNTSEIGLTSAEVKKRLEIYGYNEVAKKKKRATLIEFLSHFKNPLILILIVATAVSFLSGQLINSIIIFFMILMSVILDFFQEYRAEKAADKLRKRVTTTIKVIRNSIGKEISVSDVVPGDIICLSAGDIVPADARLINSKDFFLDQSALTGESFPVEKIAAPLKSKDISTITNWNNYLFMGTSVLSGSCTAVVVKTGSSTEYGEIVKKTIEKRPETGFEKGLTKFGYLIMKVISLLVLFVFIVNALFKHDILESLLFAIALAVGVTPELLPMILSINLSKGAMAMSKKGVIVKRLASIQNFGSMDVLCTDKTGTLTENKVKLLLHVDINGKNDEKVFLYSFLNSYHQTGLRSPLDEAILEHEKIDEKKYKKIDEIPFDFIRKRVSVVVKHEKENYIITKGAPEEIVKVCSKYEIAGKTSDLTNKIKKKIEQKHYDLSSDGFRVLGLSYKKMKEDKSDHKIKDESEMVFLGFVAFIDPPKESAKESIQLLEKVGIELKILTGDNELVTKKICEQLDFKIKGIVLGSEIAEIQDDVLARIVEKANIFTRVTPVQKNRIMNALKENGHIVGFLGDGINDSPSMRVSDVSVSVDNAVDIAKESADIILLQKDLKVLEQGVLEGRKTFGNTMKYILMGLSSNFGNMISAAGASLFLPFLPMLPIQILLNNFMYDFSQLTIPTDNVDKEYIEKPKRMDISFIKDYMIFFGPFSSIFDFLTYFVMLFVFHAPEHLFQAAWFVESFCTQTLIIFVIRTRKTPFYKSKPSKFLTLNVLFMVSLAVIIPFTFIGTLFKFVSLSMEFLAILALFVVTYLILVELFKKKFYKRYAKRLDQIS